MSVGKRSVNEHLRVNDSSDRPGSLKSSAHGSGRHRFEQLRDAIVNEEGVPKTQAMHLARQRHPDLYDDYVNGNGMGKRAPLDFESAVEAEMRKHSLTREVAGQRVAQAYGSTLPRRITKADHATADFEMAADEIYQTEGCSRVEAIRKARLGAGRDSYRRMQR
jgi:hypothetical protein